MNVRSLHRLVLTAVVAGALTCGPASPQAPEAIEKAVVACLDGKACTADVGGGLGTHAAGSAVVERILR